MIDSLDIFFLTGKFIIGILFFIRITGMFVAAPFYQSDAIPTQMKIFLAIIIALSMTTTYWQTQPEIDFHLWNLVLLVFKEFFIGAAIGFSANMVFWAAKFAGGIIDFDMGYHTASLFNRNDSSPTLVGQVFELGTLLIFLSINGHHFLIESIYASVRAVPITYFEVSQSSVDMITRLATSVLILGIKLAAPVLAALFLTNLALSLLARIAPQTNIFILSFQLKIAIGLLVLFASVPLFVMITKYSLQALESETMKLLLTLNPARVI